MQADQCGSHIGTNSWEGAWDKRGIGCDGAYCGDNDVQLDRINVLYLVSSGDKYVPRAVLFDPEPGVIDV
jgi:tubulin beta